MHPRFTSILALPLLVVAVLFALAQAWQVPPAGQSVVSLTEKIALHEVPAAALLAELVVTDLGSDETELLPLALPAARAIDERGAFFDAASTPWPFRAPDQLLRPPTALPHS